ncbi:Uncharacterised protein [Mycobacteroides abscessus subsp. abscessus]|nr:Uncharacterised protein [Mycobacteroides abscessus subsp. abscessus]
MARICLASHRDESGSHSAGAPPGLPMLAAVVAEGFAVTVNFAQPNSLAPTPSIAFDTAGVIAGSAETATVRTSPHRSDNFS